VITPRPAGSTDVADRDRERVTSDLAALEPRYPATHSKTVKWFRTRVVPGRRSPA
jgi:hypothetical protein